MAVYRFTDPVTRDFIEGSRFDDNVSFQYDFPRPLRHRVEILTELCAGKRVLHIGCCDHIGLVDGKMNDGSWLHGRLTDVAAQCIGIDIDGDAVRQTRAISKLDNIFQGDITSGVRIPEIGDQPFDFAIFGEVVEHIGNPVHFLKSFLACYGQGLGKVVITVPNAYRAGNLRSAFKAVETTNSDHRFNFTPYTIAKVAHDAGLDAVLVQTAMFSPAGLIKKAILNRYPLMAENLIYIGQPRQG